MKSLWIDIGCGRKKQKGCIGIDVSGDTDADIVTNLDKGIPLDDNSCERVYANHFLEHVKDFLFFMGEIHRVLKPCGKAFIRVPHYSHPGAFVDFTHKYFFATATFDYFGTNSYDYYTDLRFKVKRRKLIYQTDGFVMYRKVYPAYLMLRVWGWFIQRLADISPEGTERFLGFLGFKELYFELEAEK